MNKLNSCHDKMLQNAIVYSFIPLLNLNFYFKHYCDGQMVYNNVVYNKIHRPRVWPT